MTELEFWASRAELLGWVNGISLGVSMVFWLYCCVIRHKYDWLIFILMLLCAMNLIFVSGMGWVISLVISGQFG